MTVKERLLVYLEDKGIKKSHFEESIKASNGFINSIRRSISPKYLEQITKTYPDLNIQWLLMGSGSMFNTDDTDNKSIEVIKDVDDNIKTYEVPLLPLSAQGGSLNDFVTSINNIDCEKIISPIKNISFAITIAGDSMAPEYPGGSQILIKKINEQAFIEWGKVYVLDTCNGIIVKRLVPSEKTDHIKCLSDNNPIIYAPFDICTNDIFGIYKVMLCMSMK